MGMVRGTEAVWPYEFRASFSLIYHLTSVPQSPNATNASTFDTPPRPSPTQRSYSCTASMIRRPDSSDTVVDTLHRLLNLPQLLSIRIS